jgi:hypothetical protein
VKLSDGFIAPSELFPSNLILLVGTEIDLVIKCSVENSRYLSLLHLTVPMSIDNEHARSLVICFLPQLKQLPSLASVIQHATRSTRDRLVILLFSPHFDNHRKWHDVQKLLTWVYVQSTAVAQDMGKVLMEVDVLLQGSDSRETYDVKEHEFDAVYRFEEGMLCLLPRLCFWSEKLLS